MSKKWIKRRKNWNKKSESDPELQPVADDPNAPEIPYGVTWMPIRCPRCGTKNIKIRRTVKTVRYCRCNTCKWNFKATEVEEK